MRPISKDIVDLALSGKHDRLLLCCLTYAKHGGDYVEFLEHAVKSLCIQNDNHNRETFADYEQWPAASEEVREQLENAK